MVTPSGSCPVGSPAAAALAAPENGFDVSFALWSWHITKVLGPAKWTYFSLYVMLDVFSRYVVGWMVAHRESATLAERFIPHARPHVSNDNPFSEAQFKTLKYRPTFPEGFGSTQDARGHCHVFFPWYNNPPPMIRAAEEALQH